MANTWSLNERPAFRMENPFSLKVGQIFTGFGVGCGIGIGVGNPIYLGAIPAVQQVMVATRGATDIFSGVGRQVNLSLKKIGLRNVQAGVGCGIGIGHGFGVGVALKPGVIRGIQTTLEELVAKLMANMKNIPGFSSEESNPTAGPTPSKINAISGSSINNSILSSIGKNPLKESINGSISLTDSVTASRTEKVITNFLQNPLLQNDAETDFSERRGSGNLQTMNSVLQMLVKHQQIIEELMDENEKLHKILVEELKIPPSKIQFKRGIESYNTCSDCFECRRRNRKALR